MPILSEWFPLFLQRHPTLVRNSVRALQAVRPKAVSYLVTGAKAVHEIFDRPEDFLMGYLNAPKLKLGPFLLGMDPGAQHRDERALLVDALRDLPGAPGLRAFVRDESRRWAQHLAQTPPGKAIELASGYAEPVFVRALGRCFGVPVDSARSRHLRSREDSSALGLLVRTLGMTIASTHPAPFGLEALADDVAVEFRAHLQEAIALHRQGGAGVPSEIHPDTVMGRLVARQHSDNDIVRWVGGMMSASAGYPKAFSHALHELIRHEKLSEFAQAVRDGDERLVHGYIREALRFRPVFPFLIRYCPRSAQLCDPPPDARREFAAGERIKFSPLTAMFDRDRFVQPEEFNPERPAELYSLFGGGSRICIGQEFIMSLFLPMFDALFDARPDLIDHARPCRLRYDGFAIERCEVRFAPTAKGAGRAAVPTFTPPDSSGDDAAGCPSPERPDGGGSGGGGRHDDRPMPPPLFPLGELPRRTPDPTRPSEPRGPLS